MIVSHYDRPWSGRAKRERCRPHSLKHLSRYQRAAAGLVVKVLGLIKSAASNHRMLVGIRRRICMKLSIISFLCCGRASSINSLKGSLVPSSLFSPAMRGCLGMRDLFSSRETSSRPNSLYSDLVGDMH
jgi:hypothetical protein